MFFFEFRFIWMVIKPIENVRHFCFFLVCLASKSTTMTNFLFKFICELTSLFSVFYVNLIFLGYQPFQVFLVLTFIQDLLTQLIKKLRNLSSLTNIVIFVKNLKKLKMLIKLFITLQKLKKNYKPFCGSQFAQYIKKKFLSIIFR